MDGKISGKSAGGKKNGSEEGHKGIICRDTVSCKFEIQN